MTLQIAIHAFSLLVFYFSFIFVIGQIKKDNSIADTAWGGGFILLAVYSLYIGPSPGIRSTLTTLLVFLWGIRLSLHIYNRNKPKGEDYRYKAMREKWGMRHLTLKAFVYVYMTQCVLLYIIALPIIHSNVSRNQPLNLLSYFGIILWITGFIFESVGDHQLAVFKKNPQNRGKIMTCGLWSYTRHPNYFGEACMWFGIFFISITSVSSLWLIVSPLTITHLVVNVSGVKLLEKKYIGNTAFESYKATTNAFIPGPRKSKRKEV
jgi:3-oxo-5-alpha-steroid 4-dehydrogenase 1